MIPCLKNGGANVSTHWKWFITVIALLTLISCSNNQQSHEHDYQKIKEITLDVLQTKEGKKALQDLFKDPEMKQQLLLNGQELEKTLAKSISDQNTKKEWEKLLQTPEVALNLSKATEEQNKKVMKALMKDPEYQKMMLDLLKDPQFSMHILQLLSSQAAHKEIQKTIEQMIQVPSFQEKIIKLMQQSQKQKSDQQQGGQEKQSVESEGQDQENPES